MSKGQADSGNDHHGTPIYIIMSVLFALVVFAVEGLKGGLGRSSDSGLQMTALAFVALGLTLCFFWRRMHDGPIKTVAAMIYTLGLWAYLFLILGTNLLVHGPSAASKLALFHQLGVGTVILSAFVLMVALLNETKMVASLLMVGLAGLVTTFGSIFSLLQSPHQKGSDHGGAETSEHSAHSQHGDEEEELTADDHGHGTQHGDKEEAEDEHAAKSHDEDHDSASHEKTAEQTDETDEHAHDAPKKGKKADAHQVKHGSDKASRMKLSAKAIDPEEEVGEEEEDRKDDEAAHEDKPKSQKASQKKVEKHSIHWSYEYDDTGPDQWGRLSEDFALCESGTQQSPIDIPADWKPKALVKVNYKESSFDVIDNGHTVQYNVAPGNFATIGSKTYQLKQIHFHTPSEHLIRGRSAVLEAHFVHVSERGELAVLGTMIKAGKTHREYLKLWEYMPVKAGVSVKPKGVTFNPRALLPEGASSEKAFAVFNYPGSLTTPPCSEKVNWNVLADSVTMSQEQIQQFRKKYNMNARPVQDLGDRD